MSVNLVQFPLQVSEWVKNVAYLTDVIVGRNGQEVRNAIWQDPLHKFNAIFSIKNYEDIAVLVNFFHAMRGREQAFLVKDWGDFAVTEWTAFKETVDGTRTTFQLFKPYSQSIGNTTSTYERTIKYPKTDAVSIKVNDSVLASNAFSVNASTGIVTLNSAPTEGATVVFKVTEFYTPVRFDIDELPVEMISYWVQAGANKSDINIPDIPLVEVRV